VIAQFVDFTYQSIHAGIIISSIGYRSSAMCTSILSSSR
jgi:hypothetical protein